MSYAPANFGGASVPFPQRPAQQQSQPQQSGWQGNFFGMQNHSQQQVQQAQSQWQAQFQTQQPISLLPQGQGVGGSQARMMPINQVRQSEVEQVHPAYQAQMEAERRRQEQIRQEKLRKQLKQPHILLYSSHCKHCKNFFDRIQMSERYRPIFKYFCVDIQPSTGRRPKLPSSVVSVPTIIINRTIYVGEKSFEWMAKAMKDDPSIPSGGGSDALEVDVEPSAYIPLEMGNWSDSYEMIGSEEALRSFFVPIDKRKNPLVEHIITPEETGENTRSISDLERERSQGVYVEPQADSRGIQSTLSLPRMQEEKVDSMYNDYLNSRNRQFSQGGNKAPKEIDFSKLGPLQKGLQGMENKYGKEDKSKALESDFERLMAIRNRDNKKMEKKLRPI